MDFRPDKILIPLIIGAGQGERGPHIAFSMQPKSLSITVLSCVHQNDEFIISVLLLEFYFFPLFSYCFGHCGKKNRPDEGKNIQELLSLI